MVRFGWRVGFVALGLISWMIVIPLALILKRSPTKMGLLPNRDQTDSGVKGNIGKAETPLWSVSALYDHFKVVPEEFQKLCQFKWSFNIKPDIVYYFLIISLCVLKQN